MDKLWIDFGSLKNLEGNLLTDRRCLDVNNKEELIGKFNKCWKCGAYIKVTKDGYEHSCDGWFETYSLEGYFNYRTGMARFGLKRERELLYGKV